jgi:hypothetical protein
LWKPLKDLIEKIKKIKKREEEMDKQGNLGHFRLEKKSNVKREGEKKVDLRFCEIAAPQMEMNTEKGCTISLR